MYGQEGKRAFGSRPPSYRSRLRESQLYMPHVWKSVGQERLREDGARMSVALDGDF